MISKDKQYRTRNGREVRIYATDGGEPYPVHGAMLQDGEWSHETWKRDGAYICNLDESLSLIEVKPRIQLEYWVNVYEDGEICEWEDKDKADRWASSTKKRLACVKITIDCEEGEGL
jgi:hypothetical protein